MLWLLMTPPDRGSWARSGALQQVRVGVPRNRVGDHAHRLNALLPAHGLYAASLEVLVDVEEVLHFLEVVLRDVGDVEVLRVVRIVTRNGEDLVVRLAAVEHHQHADRPYIDLAPGKGRLVHEHEDVARVAILVQRSRDEAVITGIVHRGVEHAVEAQQAGVLVELVLVATAGGDLDHRRDFLRRVSARRKVAPGMDHVVTRSIVPLKAIGSSETPKFSLASCATRPSSSAERSSRSIAVANSVSCSAS